MIRADLTHIWLSFRTAPRSERMAMVLGVLVMMGVWSFMLILMEPIALAGTPAWIVWVYYPGSIPFFVIAVFLYLRLYLALGRKR